MLPNTLSLYSGVLINAWNESCFLAVQTHRFIIYNAFFSVFSIVLLFSFHTIIVKFLFCYKDYGLNIEISNSNKIIRHDKTIATDKFGGKLI